MNTRTSEPGSPNYGSLDESPSAAYRYSFQQPTERAPEIDPSVPPKPAVRQRTRHSMNISRNDLSSSIDGEGRIQQVIPMAETAKQNNDAMIRTRQQQQQELDKELVELNRSLAATKDSNAATTTAPESDISIIKGTLSLPLPTELPPLPAPEGRPYPKRVFFIVANEFCERFSYYGLRTVLVLYFRSVLGFSDANSTVSFHLFATLCYLTPILGAILGDSLWGKFKTILYLSIVYFIGELVLVLSSIFWDMGAISVTATFLGLFMIGLGGGGIKPCVSALGGDQFLPNEDKWRQTFFSLFYGAINLGSLISMFLTPMLRSDFHCAHRTDCYPYAFGLPCLLMFVSIVVFLMAKNQYTLVPLPEQNVIVAFCKCVWLALKRMLTCRKLPPESVINNNQIPLPPLSDTTSSSSLSVSSNEDVSSSKHINLPTSTNSAKSDSRINATNTTTSATPGAGTRDQPKRDHWLYLASDQFETKSIEEFRSVLGIMLLFVPIPIYWCLFDQQGSLWTLQATRMDGRIFNTGFVLQPDQISVANPLLLLAAIPVFEICIYPCLSRCNVLTKPIQRMTVGGLLASLTFVVSAMIEIRIQEFLPPVVPPPGRANLLLVNGLSECSITTPMISYVQIPGSHAIPIAANNQTGSSLSYHSLDIIEPLGSHSLNILSANTSFLNNYQLKFKLSHGNDSHQVDNNNTGRSKHVGCPFAANMEHEFSFGPLAEQSAKLLYLEQGNGKLSYKMFNETLSLPPAGKARVRLLYESFGSSVQSEKRQFFLVRLPSISNSTKHPQFNLTTRDGQVLISGYMDIDVSANGDRFVLRTNDNLISSSSNQGNVIILEPGTRNLIIVNQKDALNVEVKHELLQDNHYRISLLYQLAPYLLISVSEVMFSITGLEFSYSMAPDNMKSVILAAWCLTTAFGNILTVAVEAMHLFSNIAHDFIFYAAIMALDMILFAIIGFNYKPYKVYGKN